MKYEVFLITSRKRLTRNLRISLPWRIEHIPRYSEDQRNQEFSIRSVVEEEFPCRENDEEHRNVGPGCFNFFVFLEFEVNEVRDRGEEKDEGK